MKKLWICCFAALCMVLSGCAGNQQENQETKPSEPKDTQQEIQEQNSEALSSGKNLEPDSTSEESMFSGRWQAAETPQYYMDISSEGEDRYAIEIVWAGASRGNIVWQAEGTYDATWEGIAYTGAKCEDAVNEDGTITRTSVPEREEVTGMVYLKEDGTLYWIDDFDHTGDDISFQKEYSNCG